MEELMPINSPPLDLAPLDAKTKQIAQEILDEDDVDKVKDLTNLFNLNAQKRNVMRVIKMNDLLDKVTDQVVERFEKTPHNFSNEDLIKYMQVTENAIDRASKHLNLVEETPPIQLLQQNQVNINIENNLDRDSREKVLDVVRAILANNANSSEPIEVTNIKEDEGDPND
jgi:hypothetical protein